MRVLDPGHDYVLQSLDGDAPQRLTFVKRIGPRFPGNKGEAHAGTTMQEVLRALIDRAEYVNGQTPCAETESARALMMSALLVLETRAARRHDRVFADFTTLDEAVSAPGCSKCGHVGCMGYCHEEGH